MEPTIQYFQAFTQVTILCLLCFSKGARPEVRGKVGGVVELECGIPLQERAASARLHVVEWVRQGIDIPVLIKFGAYAPRVHPNYEGRVSLVRNTALRVKGLGLEDQGLYECRILLLDKTSDELYNGTWTLLSVTAPPTFTKTPPTVMEALVGNRLSLACIASGNPAPTITWLKDGGVIQGKNFEVQDGKLSVQAVSMESGGQYTCHASNSEGNLTHVMKLKVKGPPVIVIPPKSTSLNISQNALLRCQAVADPPNMTYVWRKGGENVYHIEYLKSRVKIMVDGTLLISSLTPEDSGNYTCMPTNGILTPPTASANLTVMHPAKALPIPEETYLPTGMDGLVVCPLRSQPPLLRVDWTKDGEPLDLALYPGWTLTSEGSLFMAAVNDDAASVYTCTPYNSYGTMGSSGPTKVILQDPPSFSVKPQKQYRQRVGGTLLIPCHGNGDPATSVTWSKVGLVPGPAFSVAANGSLLLQPLSKAHQGEWECRAANWVAVVKASTHVLVLGTTPHAATSLSIFPGVRQANISWEAGFDGGSTQTFSVWVKQISGSDKDEKREWFSMPVPPSSGNRLQVTGLSPATVYQFSVLPHNSGGTGPFSEIASVRTLDPPPQRSKLKPPVLLSANQSSAGVLLQWSPPAVQSPPITGFVLQSRTEQGEWFNLDEDIDANRSEIIVPGLRKDCVYELRLLSRRGELLSEASPSVNVSTMGMEMYPSMSRLLEFVPERLLAGVMGGVGFMCLALAVLLGTACVINHKRDRCRRKRKDDLPLPAIYKCPPSTRTSSSSSSPDSMLKTTLLPPSTLYPTTTSSTTSSSSHSDRSSLSKTGHTEYQDRCQQLLSTTTTTTTQAPLNYAQHRGHLPRAVSSPISPPLELISRGPDGRFIVQPYDKASTLRVHTKRSMVEDYPHPNGVQRSVSLHSERGDWKEPPFVLSVNLPPCGPEESSSTLRVRAMAKHLSHHGRVILDEKGGYEDRQDQSNLFLDSSHSSVAYPYPDQGDTSPIYPTLRSVRQPSTTASTLVLQMEHERERGNLSRCLKLAQEREELERELRKYTLERSAVGERRCEKPDREVEETGDNGSIWKSKSSTSPCSLLQGSRGSCDLSKGSPFPSYIHWDASPFTSPSTLVPAQSHFKTALPVSPFDCVSDTKYPAPSFTEMTPLKSEETDSCSKDRLVCPHLPSKHNRHERVEKGPEGCDNSPQPTDVEMQRNDSYSQAWGQNDLSSGSLSTQTFSHANKYAQRSNLTVTTVPGSSKAEMAAPKPFEALRECLSIEMSVDEPELEASVILPTKPMVHQSITSYMHEEHSDCKDQAEDTKETSLNCQSPVPGDVFERRHGGSNRMLSTPQPPGQVLRKAVSLGSQNWGRHQRSQSLDSRKRNKSNFLTPDAWIDSLSQENCAALFSFRPDSLLWGPQSTPALETSKPPGSTDPPSVAPSSPPHPLEQPSTVYSPPLSVDPVSPGSCPQKLTLNPTVPSSHPPHHDLNRQTSIFPDASRCPITYQEALRSVPRMEAMKEASRGSLAISTEKGHHRDTYRLPKSRCLPPHAPLYRGLSWPLPDQASSPAPEREKDREYEKEEEEAVKNERYSGHEADVEIGGYRGVPDSGSNYSSYASSGRGSLEPANGRLSICLSPTLASSPETVEESQGSTEDKYQHQMGPGKRRKASVDENYEWDATDSSSQPGDQDAEERGLFLSVKLQKSAPCRRLPSMQRFAGPDKEHTQLSSLQGHHLTSCYSEPETDTVLF